VLFYASHGCDCRFWTFVALHRDSNRLGAICASLRTIVLVKIVIF
jgi:hypothetical protein